MHNPVHVSRLLRNGLYLHSTDLDDPEQIEAAQQALEAAAAELHAAHATPRYWTDFLQVGQTTNSSRYT